MIALLVQRYRSLCTSGALLLCATPGTGFCPGVSTTRGVVASSATQRMRGTCGEISRCSSGDRHGSTRRSTALPAIPAAHGATHALQRICDGLLAGAELQDVENQLMEVEHEYFSQASAWSKTFTPFRSVVAEVADSFTISVLVLPRGTKLEWQRHDHAHSVSRLLFGNLSVSNLELQGSDNSRKLEQQELEATYTDAWAVGGSEESDCVCRGGRCPRMWDCPFWVDRRRAEAKGSSAHVALRLSEDTARPGFWRAGPQTVRRVEAVEPSAVLEVHVGPRKTRYYQEIASQAEVDNAVELIETLAPLGVKPGVCRYLGPYVDLRE
ncbi:unnamed protein product [Pylaiella littoralis]